MIKATFLPIFLQLFLKRSVVHLDVLAAIAFFNPSTSIITSRPNSIHMNRNLELDQEPSQRWNNGFLQNYIDWQQKTITIVDHNENSQNPQTAPNKIFEAEQKNQLSIGRIIYLPKIR